MTTETTRERIEREAAEREAAAAAQRRQARPEDYVYDKSQDGFWDLEDGTLHNDAALNASIPQELWRVDVQEADPEPAEGAPRPRGRPRQRRERLIQPSVDIRRVENDQFVEGSTWWPGQEKIIRDRFIDRDGHFAALGRRILNTFRAGPEPKRMSVKDAEAAAAPWLALLDKVYPDVKEREYFLDYCAHMVQRPAEKCNAAIIMAGQQRIGKDSLMEPVKAAIGTWNVKNIDPDHLFSEFNPWVQTLMLMIDEVRPSKDEFHASSMYNILKPLIAAPPHTLALNDKGIKIRHIVNVLRVVITTNDWLAMYIPPNDERMFVMNSPLPQLWYMESDPGYFVRYYEWLEKGGNEAVLAFLGSRSLAKFNPKGAVPKTSSWAEISSSWSEPEDGVMLALEALGSPQVVFGSQLLGLKETDFDRREEVANLLKSPRKLTHRMNKAGYVSVPPPPGQVRWIFKGEAGKIQSRIAFVWRASCVSEHDQRAAVLEHGAALVAKSLPRKDNPPSVAAGGGF